MNTPNSFIVSAYMYKRRRTRPIITFTEGVSTRLYKYIIISRVQSVRKTMPRSIIRNGLHAHASIKMPYHVRRDL